VTRAGNDARRGSFGADLLDELFRNSLDPGYSDAARRRAERPDQPRSRWPLVIRSLALVVIGLLLAVAWRQVEAGAPGSAKASAGLVREVRVRQAGADRLQRQADTLREEVAISRDAALADGGEAAGLRGLEGLAGLTRVTGDGLVVRLADAPTPVDPVTGVAATSNPGLILDRDLQDVANGLWSAGAEAVAINGQRLTATTAIRAAGGAILVDFQPVTGPYQVSAIGPPDIGRRFEASTAARRAQRLAQLYHLSFRVRAASELVLPAGPEPQLRYARTPPSPSPSPSASDGRPSGSPARSPTPSATGGK
jgi:uncharacterized protein YlxW (UPF0749 family)